MRCTPISQCTVLTETPPAQGYGLTESCGPTCVANPKNRAEAGSVGAPVAGVEVRLLAVPDMGYNPMADPPRGELLVRGETMFATYHKREDLTSEAVGAPFPPVAYMHGSVQPRGVRVWPLAQNNVEQSGHSQKYGGCITIVTMCLRHSLHLHAVVQDSGDLQTRKGGFTRAT